MELILNGIPKEMVNSKDYYEGQTPLHYASKVGFTERMQLLVDYGAFIDVQDYHGLSPFLWAVIANQLGATRLLLSRGVDINSTSLEGKSALGLAVNLGHEKMIRLLVEEGADIMFESLDDQMTPLEEAAACGSLQVFRLLLNRGSDMNHHAENGWSAIHFAAEEGHLEILDLLLTKGANVNAINSFGVSPLHCAANGGHTSIVKLLLQRGADPHKSTCRGWTPLHYAAFKGYSDVVRSLVDISTPSQDRQGWSALHLAVHGRHLGTIRELLNSPILSESRSQYDERYLTPEDWLDIGIDSSSYQNMGNQAFQKSRCCGAVTSLRQAVCDNNFGMTEYLLSAGYGINDTNSGNRAALYCAVDRRSFPMIDLLLKHGADPNILPRGHKAWEEFITDEVILGRLRAFGYGKPIPDAEIDRQIRLALRMEGEPSTSDEPALQRSWGPPDRINMRVPPRRWRFRAQEDGLALKHTKMRLALEHTRVRPALKQMRMRLMFLLASLPA
ncbi:hypothetical protein RRF57_010363 [Xylaria bambusicola]|uniref:Ankyrin n=1 Tax=Xylaria bambusicola TaxID=326684 RepID=A0AAN7UL51_9PEZI